MFASPNAHAEGRRGSSRGAVLFDVVRGKGVKRRQRAWMSEKEGDGEEDENDKGDAQLGKR